jgi:dihydrofolate reductase
MKAIVAMDENRGIGKSDTIPWKISDDLKWFKTFTTGKVLIAGHKTFDEMPVLKNRNVVVMTRYPHLYQDGFAVTKNAAYTYRDAKEILNLNSCRDIELVVIGGAKTYELFLPHITEFYVTHVKGVYDADTFMPPFEHIFDKREKIKEFDGHVVIKYSN